MFLPAVHPLDCLDNPLQDLFQHDSLLAANLAFWQLVFEFKFLKLFVFEKR